MPLSDEANVANFLPHYMVAIRRVQLLMNQQLLFAVVTFIWRGIQEPLAEQVQKMSGYVQQISYVTFIQLTSSD